MRLEAKRMNWPSCVKLGYTSLNASRVTSVTPPGPARSIISRLQASSWTSLRLPLPERSSASRGRALA